VFLPYYQTKVMFFLKMKRNSLNLMKNCRSGKFRYWFLSCNIKVLACALAVVAVLSVAGCTPPKRVVYVPQTERGLAVNESSSDRADGLSADVLAGAKAIVDPNKRYVAALLKLYVHDWRGTPYRRGGMSHRGVDCSGFTLLTFRDIFGLDLPRTTGEQAGRGEKIKKKELVPGDLVFFKTGIWQKHVGVCLDKTRFAHASLSKGVTVSSLEEDYWREHFWQARRLAPEL